MASILICHAPADAAAAGALADALAKRGHRLSFDGEPDTPSSDRLARLGRADAVIVVWTQSSIGSGGLSAIAAEALRLDRLVPVHAEGLALEGVPVSFRVLATLSIRDIDGIAHQVARLAMAAAPAGEFRPPEAPRGTGKPMGVGGGLTRFEKKERPLEGIGSGYQARPVLRPAPSPQQEALAVGAGQLVHKIPDRMWVGEPETVEVRLGREGTADLVRGLVGRGPLTDERLPIVETMSVSLYARGGAFDIERQSETTQLVMGDQLKGTPLEGADYGRWVWLVTPRKTGAHRLFVRVSAALKDSRGVPTSASLPDREFEVSVSVHKGKATIKVLRAAFLAMGGAVGAGLLGAITQELWWPKLKALLESWGWLG